MFYYMDKCKYYVLSLLISDMKATSEEK